MAIEDETIPSPPERERERLEHVHTLEDEERPGAPDENEEAVSAEQPGRYAFGAAEVGRGGIGRVLVAFDTHLGREIALKELLPSALRDMDESHATRSVVARFLREARVTAQLEHPNIVPVYELGKRKDGTLYYTMKLVRGRTLSEAVKKCVDLGERLRLLGHFVDLCQAIAYAHSRGVVHRDVKPQNVMLGEFGETLLLDWGLAKLRGKRDIRGRDLLREIRLLHGEQTANTLPGAAFGTPAYMSPEQAEGKIEEVDERSDVWSLGVVLYEILTGGLPFEGDHALSIIAKVLKDDPVPVLAACPEAPEELAAVAERALARNKADRYQTAKELADEVEAFQNGGRVEAYRYSNKKLIQRYVETHRPQLIAGAIALASMLIFAVGAHQGVLEERDRALKAEAEAEKSFAEALAERARSSALQRDFMAAEIYAAAALSHREESEGRGVIVATTNVPRPKLLFETLTWSGCLRVVISPDGGTIACPSTSEISLLDASTGEETTRLRAASGWVEAVAYSPDGSLLAYAADSGWVGILELGSGKEIAKIDLGRTALRAITFSPDGRSLAAAGDEGVVHLLPVGEGTERRAAVSRSAIVSLDFSPDGTLLAAGGKDRAVRILDGSSLIAVRTFFGHQDEVTSVAFSPGGDKLASSSADRTVRVWPASGEGQPALYLGHESEVHQVDFSPDGRWLYTSGGDKTVRIWDQALRRNVLRLDGHEDRVWSVTLSLDGKRLVSASKDKTVRGWDVSALVDNRPPALHVSAPLRGLGYSADGKRVFWGSAGGAVHAEGEVYFDSGAAMAAFAVLDGGALALLGEDEVLRVLTPDDEKAARKARVVTPAAVGEPLPPISGVIAAYPAKNRLAIMGTDRALRIIDVGTGRVLDTFPVPGDSVRAIAFSADGTRLAFGGNDRAVHLLDLTSKREIARLSGHEGAIEAICFLSGGRRLAASGADKTVRLFDVDGKTEIAKLEAHADEVRALACAPDGLHLVSGGDDKVIHFWDLSRLETPGRTLASEARRDFGLKLAGSRIFPERRTGHR